MKQPKKWTVTDVADRFEEAAQTLRRMPPVKVQGYFNVYPDVIRTSIELMQADVLPMRLGPPSAEAISRMEETIQWIFYLDDEEERRLVWLRAERVVWKRICWRLGCGRTKAWQMWTYALLKIVTRLNSKLGGR
ncbi:MAG: RNA polymerase subunit sigma [Rickettsiales bacterium]|nr:RNA polymerase subunit sigma [Rickettsiales bacterium]